MDSCADTRDRGHQAPGYDCLHLLEFPDESARCERDKETSGGFQFIFLSTYKLAEPSSAGPKGLPGGALGVFSGYVTSNAPHLPSQELSGSAI